MRKQHARNVVDQRFLQVDVPLFNAVADGEPNEVVVDHFMNPVMARSGKCERNEHVDVQRDALRAILLVRVNTDVGFEDVVAQKNPAAIGKAGVYLASAEAVTGAILLVDGGQHLVPSSRDVMFLTEKQTEQ